ncbi:cyclic pyranopterin monophosphate synthase MoaC [bacterium]|nr:cyclic pyranopterin monophosphate synthase MoaC [bacterium]MCK4326551.1 cyclic pyranopterin monophosphate synthase MoaC [bacterium]MCK4436556.1 cyclic pyranopterin monophosphate synthase MoaC [bacterium]
MSDINMVDITAKPMTERSALARGIVSMKKRTIGMIKEGEIAKGDVLAVAKVAGILAAKRTALFIPLCHPLNITHADISFKFRKDAVEIESVVKLNGKTGAEMEALSAVAVAALTIYDMCKAVDKEMTISRVRLIKKTGGRSGDFIRR